MRLPLRAIGLALCLPLFAAAAPDAAAAQSGDVVIVLDNSGSMRKNDRQRLAPEAVARYVERLEDQTRAALLIFDGSPRLVVSLGELDRRQRRAMASGLEEVDYRGKHTNIPGAIERALYHLRHDGQDAARKSILFLTDGRVDTGDAERDRDLTEWLQGPLMESAEEAGVRVYGIAFTESADYRTIQTLASGTGGDYVRVLKPQDLSRVFERLRTAMAKPPPEPSEERLTASKAQDEAEPGAAAADGAEGGSDERAERSDQASSDESAASSASEDRPRTPGALLPRWRPYLPWLGAGAGAVVLLVGLLWWSRRRRGRGAAPSEARDAVLIDVSGVTDREEHPLGATKTVIGRRPAPAERGLTSVVIDRKTISRQHALISHLGNEYWIEDQGTTNGTFVNGERLTAMHRLEHGDRVRLEKFELEFRRRAQEGDDDEDDATVFAGIEQVDFERADEPLLSPESEVKMFRRRSGRGKEPPAGADEEPDLSDDTGPGPGVPPV